MSEEPFLRPSCEGWTLLQTAVETVSVQLSTEVWLWGKLYLKGHRNIGSGHHSHSKQSYLLRVDGRVEEVSEGLCKRKVHICSGFLLDSWKGWVLRPFIMDPLTQQFLDIYLLIWKVSQGPPRDWRFVIFPEGIDASSVSLYPWNQSHSWCLQWQHQSIIIGCYILSARGHSRKLMSLWAFPFSVFMCACDTDSYSRTDSRPQS